MKRKPITQKEWVSETKKDMQKEMSWPFPVEQMRTLDNFPRKENIIPKVKKPKKKLTFEEWWNSGEGNWGPDPDMEPVSEDTARIIWKAAQENK